METPVIYLQRGGDTKASACRMGGLQDLFNVVSVNDGHLIPQFDFSTPITKEHHPKNKKNWRDLAEKLKTRCRIFIDDTK